MSEYVELYLKRNRGWPWPEDSFGLTPMFGIDGWCHSCGVPKHAQTGSIVLQRKSLKVEGAWVPNWQFDVICLGSQLAGELSEQFNLQILPVDWHPSAPGDASQIVISSVGSQWFDHAELRDRMIARHGVPGATCAECGVWRWMPMGFDLLPPLRIEPELGDSAIAASPEWFGDGLLAFRQILVRRDLADLLASASPRDFKVQNV